MLNVNFIEKKRFFVSSFIALLHVLSRTLHETRPNTEFFLVRIFLYSDLIRRFTAWKASKYRDFSGLYFPVLGLNIEIYGVNLRIQSE